MESKKKVGGEACGENPVAEEVKEPEVPSRKQEDLYKADEEKLRTIFPEETWEKILSKMDPEDQQSCANASPYFWELLQKQRVDFLFPKVIDVMALMSEQYFEVTKVSTEEKEWDEYAPRTEPRQWPFEMQPDEWIATVLNCRLVSSSWNKAVEKCYEKPEMTGVPELKDVLDPRSKVNFVLYVNWAKHMFPFSWKGTDRWLHQFVEHFDQSHHSGIGAPPKNPFIGRYVFVTIGIILQLTNLNEMLERFGKEIWYFGVQIEGKPSPNKSLELFRNLKKCLGLLPNLRYLEITANTPLAAIKKPPSKKGKRAPATSVVSLPKLDQLEGLFMKSLGTQIGSELIRKNCHVKYLKLKDMDELDQDIENSVEMPNLTRFSIKDTTSGDKMMENLGPRWNNLKSLYYGRGYYEEAYYHSVEPSVGMGAPKAFAIFQRNWAETLTDLYLDHPFGFDEKTILEESKTLRLDLPGVRKLTLCEFRTFFLDFTLPLKGLQHLVIRFDDRLFREESWERVKKEQNIQLAGFEKRMEMSNIWQFFGKLETVSVQELYGFSTGNILLVTRDKEKYRFTSDNGLALF